MAFLALRFLERFTARLTTLSVLAVAVDIFRSHWHPRSPADEGVPRHDEDVLKSFDYKRVSCRDPAVSVLRRAFTLLSLPVRAGFHPFGRDQRGLSVVLLLVAPAEIRSASFRSALFTAVQITPHNLRAVFPLNGKAVVKGLTL